MFRIFKTKNQEVIDIFKKIEDQLIIERKTNRIAKLYYDYNGEDRLEIRSSTFAYVLSSSYTDIIKKMALDDKLELSTAKELLAHYRKMKQRIE